MSFPLPVGTEGTPAPTGPGWPPLSPETLRDMAVTLAVLPNPRAFEGEPTWSGWPCSCPYPSACLGGDKGHCGVHVYVLGASPQLRGRALRPQGAGSKATSASVQDARLGQAPGSRELGPRCSPHGHPMAAPRRSLRGSVVGLDPRIPGGLGHGRLSRAGTRRLAWSRAHWSRPSQTSDVGPGRAKGRAWGFLSHGGGWGCSCDHFRNLPDELAGALDDMAPGAVGRWWPRARGAAGRVGRWWPRAQGAAGRAPVRGGARPAPTRPFPTGLSTLAPPLRLQQCGWPGAWGLGVWGGWGCLCMGVLLVGQAGPQAEPCPHPSRGLLSPGHLLAQGGCRRISGSRTGAARACGHSRWSPLLPRAACPRGPQSPCPGHLRGAAAADVLLRGPPASPGPGPGVPAWVGLPAHAESAHADKPPVPSSGTWPHPREPPMPVFPRSLPTAGSCCHPNRALRGPAPSPMLAGKAGSVPACPPSALHSHLHGAWHRRPPAGSCPLCGPAPLA